MPHRHRHHRGLHHHGHLHQHLTYIYLILNIRSVDECEKIIKVATLSKDYLVMDTQVSIGHVINCQLDFLDQNGNSMLTPVKPDIGPSWSNIVPTVETLVASADGLQAVLTPVAVGVDTVTVDVLVAGVKFQATLNVAVTPAPQVLTSVSIVPTVV